MLAIYEKGKCNLQTTVDDINGICHYTDKTVDEYLKELGENFSCIPLNAALDQIFEAENDCFIKPWQEISEKDYDYHLEVLPPQKWLTVDGVNIFRMIEGTIGNITLHCASVNTPGGHKFFKAERRTTDSYKDMAKEIKELV